LTVFRRARRASALKGVKSETGDLARAVEEVEAMVAAIIGGIF